LCASVGNKRGLSIVDARCNHEVSLYTVILITLTYYINLVHGSAWKPQCGIKVLINLLVDIDS